MLQLTGVTRHFPSSDGNVAVLKNINLSIDAGEIVAIVGASGSGKSTLMNILGCLDQPSEGSYKVGGRETRELSADDLAQLRREHFGFIFQRYHLLHHLDAAQNVEMPAVYAGTAQAERHARAQSLLAHLGLANRSVHHPHQLSGGQQQRVSIARALMNGGEVILADEPTGALDSKSGQAVIDILRELNALGHTVIIVTHDQHIAAHAQRIIELSDGEIVSDRQNPHASDVGLIKAAVQNKQLITTPAGGQRQAVSAARFAESFRMAWIALASHRLRTLLTMLGIIIGITSVVSIIAIGEGAKRYMLAEIRRIGTNTISIYPGMDWGDSRADTIQTLLPADAAVIANQHYVDSATPETSRNLLLRYRHVDVNAIVSGVGERYFQVRGIQLAQGAGFGPDEVRRQAQVAVIDQNTRRKLFPADQNPLGKIILVDRLPCIVTGVTDDRKSTFGNVKGLNVWVPYTTASGRLFGQYSLDSITVRVRDGQPSHAAEQSLTALLRQRHGRQDFFTYNMDSIVKTAEKTGRSLTLLLSLVAVISLVVGGIGVMNIMLVSVTERTREIGIRMAVGARRADIMQQFLVEAVMVCLIGGAIGITLSFCLSPVFAMFVDQWKMVFSAEAIAAALLCSTLTGIIFGFMPARNAARLSPIDALARD